MDHNHIFKAAASIEEILDEYTIGWANEEAKKKIEKILFDMQHSTNYNYILEKLGSIQGWINILYSERKHSKYPGGADQVKGFILSDCCGIKSYLTDFVKPAE